MIITGLNKIPLAVSDSTQHYLKNLVEQQVVPDGTLVVAAAQTHGRGMAGASWESEPGKNLLFSFVRYPAFLPVKNFFLLNKYVSLAVFDAMQHFLPGHKVSIKWPNDIYVDDLKICGMLIENSIMGECFQYSVSGIGLNVNQTDFSSVLPNPASMKLFTGIDYNLDEVLEFLCRRLDARFEQLLNQKRALNFEYLSHLFRVNEWAEYEHYQTIIKAKIIGINRYGMLQLMQKGGKRMECDMKTIKFILKQT